MAKIDLAGVVKFEVGVDEVIKVTRELLNETKQAKVRLALERMSIELRKGNKQLVEGVLGPLYELDSQSTFESRFGRLRAKYKRMFLQQRPVMAKINCARVQQQLDSLRQSQQWRKRLPVFRRSVARLELVAESWIANDWYLSEADREMLEEINRFLDEIDTRRETDSQSAFQQFREGLLEFEDSWLRVRDRLADLELLSDEITRR